jgi:hypothetical protein
VSIGLSFGAPFDEQVQFLRDKVRLPTDRWTDLLGSAHDRAFVVAGAAKAELLNDLHKTLLAPGMTLERFRREFGDIVRRHGWTGWTGEGSAAGVAWRTNVIYKTNMLSSYAAGRWAQMTSPDALAATPYWLYRHSDSVLHPRPLHVSWDGLILRAENPWWRTHYPPNGWGCMCKVFALSAAEVESRGLTVVDAAPDDGFDAVKNPANGETVQVPRGIDFGWDYAPGRTWMPAVDKYPEPLARAVINDYVRDGVFERWHSRLENQVADWKKEDRFSGLIGDDLVDALRRAGVVPKEQLAIAVVDSRAREMLGAREQVLRMSADTAVKQIVKRENQSVDVESYLGMQRVLDEAQVVREADDGNKVAYWRAENGDVWFCVVKVTGAGELFFVSYRQESIKRIKKLLSQDELERLGVA